MVSGLAGSHLIHKPPSLCPQRQQASDSRDVYQMLERVGAALSSASKGQEHPASCSQCCQTPPSSSPPCEGEEAMEIPWFRGPVSRSQSSLALNTHQDAVLGSGSQCFQNLLSSSPIWWGGGCVGHIIRFNALFKLLPSSDGTHSLPCQGRWGLQPPCPSLLELHIA
jgi:hypothetical protein